MDGFNIIIYCISLLVIAIANIGGIGSGIIKVPFLMLLLMYNQSMSTAITYPILFGGALANVVKNIKKAN
jgi:uncharacterized membrane protein YfcA